MNTTHPQSPQNISHYVTSCAHSLRCKSEALMIVSGLKISEQIDISVLKSDEQIIRSSYEVVMKTN